MGWMSLSKFQHLNVCRHLTVNQSSWNWFVFNGGKYSTRQKHHLFPSKVDVQGCQDWRIINHEMSIQWPNFLIAGNN